MGAILTAGLAQGSLINNRTKDNLIMYYAAKYNKPENDAEAVTVLVTSFGANVGRVTNDVREGIAEYYRVLLNRSLPAFEWIMEAIHVASKKESNKRNLPYIIGMIRTWMQYGFGHIPSGDEEEIMGFFSEITGLPVTMQSRSIVQELIGKYGAVKAMRVLGGMQGKVDVSALFASALKEAMEEKYQ